MDFSKEEKLKIDDIYNIFQMRKRDVIIEKGKKSKIQMGGHFTSKP